MARLERTTAAALNRPAKRPVYSGFDTSKISGILHREPLPWADALGLFLAEIGVSEAR